MVCVGVVFGHNWYDETRELHVSSFFVDVRLTGD